MKIIDIILQKWRNSMAVPFITTGAKVLDIGCADQSLFELLGPKISFGVGIDPNLRNIENKRGNIELIAGSFPMDLPAKFENFDTITVLAVLEHIPESDIPEFVKSCVNRLKPAGVIIITVPSKQVDYILAVLKFIKAVDGMELEQHHGFDPHQVIPYFSTEGLKMVKNQKFQLGLNNLFVFRKFA